MKITQIRSYPNTPFSIDVENVENLPGTWDSNKITIYRDDIVIGEYLRNYPVCGKETFYPFLASDNNWYALYSPHYLTVRVMKITDTGIEDWCGQDPADDGFCPTEFYIPKYIHSKFTIGSGGNIFDSYLVDCDVDADEFNEELRAPTFIKDGYCEFGFLCGCIWGDDSSRKLLYIDLSKIPEKIITVEAKFGYWEIPNSLSMKECIKMDTWSPTHNWVELIKSEHFNLTNEQG